MVQENLADLQKKCAQLKLEVVQSGKRPAKADYVKVLREFYLQRDFPKTKALPYEEIEPMLCFAEWNLKPDEQTLMWTEGNNWVVQKKLNGCRAIVHFVKGVGVFAHSRTISMKTYRFESMHESFLWKDYVPNFTATIDTEIIIEKPIDTTNYVQNKKKAEKTKSSLHSIAAALHLEPENSRRLQVDQDAPFMFYVFDIMKADLPGTIAEMDLRNLPLKERLRYLSVFQTIITIGSPDVAKYLLFPSVTNQKKREFFERIIKEGGEGVIAKNLHSKYEDSSSRGRNAWVKVKKRMELDAYVTGFERGTKDAGYQNLVGNLQFSVMTEKGEHMIACPSNMTLEDRRKITIYDPETDKVEMVPKMYGRVAQVSGQDISGREYRLTHCTLDRWRPEEGPDAKRKEDCKMSWTDLFQAAAWVG